MSEATSGVYAPSSAFVENALVNADQYAEMYARSLSDPEGFWGEMGQRLDWMKPFTRVKNTRYDYGSVSIKWYEDGTLNACYNCVDRHLETRGDQTAIIFEPDDPEEDAKHITYKMLHEEVCKMANILEGLGVRKGDRVVLYLPMIPEAAYSILACARIGAIHSIVFAGFSPDALAARVNGSNAKVVITADYAPRGGRQTPLKTNCDQALNHVPHDCKLLVVKRTGGQTPGWTAATSTMASCTPRPSRVTLRGDGRRRSALHPLHLRLHRPAQRRRALHRRLSGLRLADHGNRVRLQRG